MKNRILFAALVCTLFSAVAAAADVGTASRDLANALRRIKSYDVRYTSRLFSVVPAANGKYRELYTLAHSLRDTFAFGRGRRVEFNCGSEPVSMSVVDWAAAHRDPARADHNLRRLPVEYFSFFDPICTGNEQFLSRVVNSRATRKLIPPDDEHGGLTGLQLDLGARNWFVRVWCDPSKGGAPRFIEMYKPATKGDAAALDSATTVTDFKKLADGTWVPIAGHFVRWLGLGRPYSGFDTSVDAARSSWNSAIPGEMFTPASLPAVNFHREPDGWAEDLNPVLLASYLAAWPQPASLAVSHPWRVALIVANVVIVLVLLSFVAAHRLRKRRIA